MGGDAIIARLSENCFRPQGLIISRSGEQYSCSGFNLLIVR